ncbi:transcriptional regulator [Amaricoccus sp.]|uniref:helix-turn-helix domain-containing protein n=1 Tax=Amaricoccus sp. TaxID=1872485 RepID=UPI00263042B2|nr:transcriptional regulator [Amaricoccus sp.]HRO11452.1 transcriptional regulator [Amaricoccus sp.]
MPDLHPIRTPDDHREALRRIEELWGAEPGTADGNLLDILIDLVEHYEDRHCAIPDVEPIEVLRFSMEANGRTQADLAELLGSTSRASEVLGGRRRLSMGMIAKLQAKWHIPAGALVPAYEAGQARAG